MTMQNKSDEELKVEKWRDEALEVCGDDYFVEGYIVAKRSSKKEIEDLRDRLKHEVEIIYGAAKDEIKQLKARLERAEKVIEDFKDYGTRHDKNPTGQFMECGCFNSFAGDHWQSYIRTQDDYVRETARQYFTETKDSITK